MRRLLQLLSGAGLVMTVLPSFFVFAGSMPWRTHAQLMFAGMVLWFVTAPFWMNRDEPGEG